MKFKLPKIQIPKPSVVELSFRPAPTISLKF